MVQAYHMVHIGWICLDITVRTFVWYVKIQGWYARLILYKYVLMYQTVVNTFGLLWTTHANMWQQYLMTQRMHWTCHYTLCEAILFRHLIGVNCILYIVLNPIYQVRNILVYPTVIVTNIIRTIRQALTIFSKPGTYG